MSIRKKISIQFIASTSATAVNFLLCIILSRMLSPSEIGIYSMAAVVVNVAQVFRDFGVAAFIKQQKKLDPEILRAAMGVLICASWAIATLLFILSWPISDFYQKGGVRYCVQVLAVGFIFIPFGSISQAVLARDLQAEKQAVVTTISTFIYFIASIGFAWAGFGYMTMAWSNLVNIITSVIVFTVVRPQGLPWLPSFRGWARVINFGTGSILANIARTINEGIGDLLLGRLSASHFVGIYSRANSTVNIGYLALRPTVDYVALPYLAKLHHSGADIIQQMVRSTAYLTSILWPVLVATAFFSSDIVKVLYGQRWLEAAIAIPWLCLAVGIRLTFHLVQPAVTGVGRPYWAAVPIGSGIVFKVVFVMTTFDGTLLSVARAMVIAEIVTAAVFVITAKHVLQMRLRDWWLAIRGSASVLALTTLAILLLMVLDVNIQTPILRLFFAGLFLVPVWIAVNYMLDHPITSEISILLKKTRRNGI